MTDKEDATFEDNLTEASEKLNVEIDWARAFTPAELQYLLDHCPFLQITDTAPDLDQPNKIDRYEADTKWEILSYGHAMSSSPGKLLYGGGYFRMSFDDDDDEGGSGIVNPGQGTIVNQAFNTARQMADIAKALGWKGIHIIDGHPIMKRGVWIAAEEFGLEITGFKPDKNDLRIKAIVGRTAEDVDAMRHRNKGPSL